MKNQNIKLIAFVALCLGLSQIANAQSTSQKIGDNSTLKNASTVLELESTNKGMLMPRIALTSTILAAPVTLPADALTVFNTATAGTSPNNVTPGYYYWSSPQSKWVRLLDQASIADVRVVGTDNHISQDAGVGANGTSIPGNDNIAIGKGAMNAATGGAALVGNVAIGGGNQLANVAGSGNIALGYGNLPVATGAGNIAIGALSLTGLTTGQGNTAIGANALKSVTTGTQNIAFGSNTLNLATGSKNLGFGIDVLTKLTTGTDNVGFGVASGNELTTGNYNTFFGTEAGNRILGAAGEKYTSGSNSLFLGSQTKAQSTISNQLNIGNWIYGVNGAIALGDFTGATVLPTIDPTNRLDVTAGNVRVRDLFGLAGSTATDKVVVTDGNGVLKTVTVASLAGAAVTADNGLTKTLNNIQLGGPLTKNTTVNLNTFSLLFTAPERNIRFDNNGRIGSEAKGTNDGDIYVSSGSGVDYSRFDMQTFPGTGGQGQVNLTATGATEQLSISTHMTTLPAALAFSTSAGSNASGTEKMRITGTGLVGIATDDPSEKLDNVGTTRLRNLPLNGAVNAISTTVTGDPSPSQNQTFTATRTVVADVNGVLGTVVGLPAGPVNIYNANGTLTSNRTLGLNGHDLYFNGTEQQTFWSADGSMNQSGSNGRASLSMYGGDDSNLFIQQFKDSNAQISTGGNSTGLYLGTSNTNAAAPITFNTSTGGGVSGTEKMRITPTGEVAIGATIAPTIAVGATTIQPKLYVNGDISSSGKVWTTNSVYADYVFEDYFNGFSKIYKDYKFKSLKEVSEFIKANKHLPGITPISEITVGKNGYTIDLTQLSMQQLEKLEELYLHVIEMNDALGQKDKEIKALQNKTNDLEERLKKLEQLLNTKP